MKVVLDLQECSFVSWRINTTFISLLPKVEQQNYIGEYRLISLLHGVYKILAKTLAMRLESVLDRLISPYQRVAIKGHSILDEVLVANELADSRLRIKEPGLLYKVDFQKLFDCMSWGCLDYVLSRMGYGLKWRSWIRTYISTARFSVLVNGFSFDLFENFRGLYQGDPLSPMIFVIVVEALLNGSASQDLGLLMGFRVASGREPIPIHSMPMTPFYS